MLMRTLLILALLMTARGLSAQNFPDRIVVVDPLGDVARSDSGATWLPGTTLYAEFSRYSNGSGSDHRWNARTGGSLEIVRLDNDWSLHAMGTMEVVVDPQNDITFNPRAIFWEEGLFAQRNLSERTALQFGYMHRCKHDIDNLEVFTLRGEVEQRTLIFSGPSIRYMIRPRSIDSTTFEWGMAIREDFFLHLLDDRMRSDARGVGRSIESAVSATTLDARGRWRPGGGRVACGINVGLMVAAYGSEPGFSARFSDISLVWSVPYVEVGLDFFNPDGGSLVVFARAEYQRDAAITSIPQPKDLVMFGIRMGSWKSTW